MFAIPSVSRSTDNGAALGWSVSHRAAEDVSLEFQPFLSMCRFLSTKKVEITEE